MSSAPSPAPEEDPRFQTLAGVNGVALRVCVLRQRILALKAAEAVVGWRFSALVLDSAGRQGVRYVQADGRVAFAPDSIIEETRDGVWVTGLKGDIQLITVGQSYVGDGQKVRVALAR